MWKKLLVYVENVWIKIRNYFHQDLLAVLILQQIGHGVL